jgi:hypothetical protein
MPTSFSINNSYGMVLEAIVLAIVAVVALIAGAAANRKSGYSPKTGVDFVQALFTVGIIGIFATYLGNISGAWSLPETAATPENTGSVSFGVLLASLALVVSIFVIFAWISGAKAENGIATAFPRWVSRLSGTRTSDRNQGIWILFGRLSTALLALGLVIYPITSATVSRVWATTDSPYLVGQTLSAKVLDEKLDAIKTLVGPDVADEEWLPNEVLTAALPKSEDALKIAVNNDQKKTWVVGNTDATVTVTWTRDSKKAKWIVPTSSKMNSHFLLVDHPNFSAKIAPMFLNIQVNEFISSKIAEELKVNGTLITPGTYAVIPGFYRITLPGEDLISPTDITVATDGVQSSFVAGNDAVIPQGGDEKLNNVLDEKEKSCEKISKNGNASCFSSEDVSSNADGGDATAPGTFFESETGSYKLEAFNCISKDVDSLTGSDSMERVRTCDVKVSYTTAFYDGKVITKTVRVPYRYDACPWNWEDYCWETSYTTRVDKTRVRGKKLATVHYVSEFKAEMTATGTLRKGKFTVK